MFRSLDYPCKKNVFFKDKNKDNITIEAIKVAVFGENVNDSNVNFMDFALKYKETSNKSSGTKTVY